MAMTASLIGYTYPRLLQHRVVWWIWKRVFCPHGWHLWDEVGGETHYLYCDACEIEAHLKE